jgi:ribosomal protein S18 acetylase RimI-like enzyme
MIPRVWRKHHAIVEGLLSRSTAIIACNPEDPDHIVGYIVFEDGVIHWLYVKKPFRQRGIGRELLAIAYKDFADEQVHYSHSSRIARAVAQKIGAIYDPYLALAH